MNGQLPDVQPASVYAENPELASLPAAAPADAPKLSPESLLRQMPAPWVIVEADGIGEAFWIHAAEGSRVCLVDTNWRPSVRRYASGAETFEAARLIAQAPALAAALRDLRRMVRRQLHGEPAPVTEAAALMARAGAVLTCAGVPE